MRFTNPIPFILDIVRLREFYEEKLGLEVLEDFGSFVLFETGFAIYDGAALEQTVWGQPSPSKEPYGRRNLLLSPLRFCQDIKDHRSHDQATTNLRGPGGKLPEGQPHPHSNISKCVPPA